MTETMSLEQKKQLFDGLYALDESSEDERDDGHLESVDALSWIRDRTVTAGTGPSTASRGAHGLISRSSGITRTVSAPISSAPRAQLAPPQQTTISEIISPPSKLRRHHTTIGASISEHIMPKGKGLQPGGRFGVQNDRLGILPEDRQTFGGLRFYFFPANNINPARKARILKARQHGATWEQQWTGAVTHIIADRSMTYDHVLKYLRLDSIPPNIFLVNEDYPAECIRFKTILPPGQKQFGVQGAPEAERAVQPTPAGPSNSALSDRSLELKPAGKAVTVREPQTPSTVDHVSPTWPIPLSDDAPPTSSTDLANDEPAPETSYNDDLEIFIQQTKHLKHLPLDEEDEEASRPSSSSSKEQDEQSSEDEAERPRKRSKSNPNWQDNFQCMKKHTAEAIEENPNAATIAILQEMADYYSQIRDEWRPFAYRRAIATLRKHPVKVTSRNQALELPYIGERLADKIEEIAYTNRLRRLDNAREEPTDQTLQLFLKVYGAGFSQASKWVAQGFRTLDDLVQKAGITYNQKIGIEHYTDFDTRVPRTEVKQHANIVRAVALKLDPDSQVYTMGSFRRGAITSGDIDLIITHPSSTIHQIRTLVTEKLVPSLFANNFLKAALAATSKLDGTKWHGASCLPGSTIWRRIDLLLVPAEELGAALIYFTGNDIFNRSLRLLASKKGMRLNQRGLYKDVMRSKGREMMSEGTLVEGRDEKRIFEVLGVPWRPPEHRIC